MYALLSAKMKTNPAHPSLVQLQFVSPSAEEFDVLQRQLKARLEEGQGEAIYEIGMGGRWIQWGLGKRTSIQNINRNYCALALLVQKMSRVAAFRSQYSFFCSSIANSSSPLPLFIPLLLPISSTVGCSANGLQPDKMEASLATVASLASACNADFQVLRQKPMEAGTIAQVVLRRKVNEDDFLEVRCVLI